MLEPGLRPLLQPTDPWTFFSQVFARQHLRLEPGAEHLAHLVEDLGGLDLRTLLQGPRRPEINLSCSDPAQWFSTADTEEALAAYAAGFTAYFHVGQLRPRLLPWIDGLAEGLGVHFEDVDLSIFASPPGSQTPLHYDAAQNFTLQLAGTKRWRVAPNRNVAFPRTNWTAGRAISPHWRGQPPGEGAEPELQEVTLTPGRGLYLPGGYWHAVESVDYSLAITYAVNPPRGLDLVLDALAEQLAKQQDLRQPRMLGLPEWVELSVKLDPKELRSDRGLHPGLWRALCAAPPPIGHSVLHVALAASGLDPEALTEHAWATLWVAKDSLTWSAPARARLEALLQAS